MNPEPDPSTIVYFNNQFLELRDAQVGILTHAFHYGTGVFDGIRGYWDRAQEELFLLRPADHFLRWKKNCGILRIDVPATVEMLSDIVLHLIARNEFETNIYIRPLAYKCAERIGISPNDQNAFLIAAMPYGAYFAKDKGLHAGISSWRRVEDNAIPGRAKICGSYVNSVLASEDARLCGFDEAIFLAEDGHVAEGASCNIFMVRGGKLVTPSVSQNILEGITRDCVIQLARWEMNLDVVERPIDRSELYVCDELFFTGTAAEISPIVRIDHRPVGAGVVGEVAGTLRRLFNDAARGHLPRYWKWLVPAYRTLKHPTENVEGAMAESVA